MTVSVVLVDDETALRSALAVVLGLEEDIEIVADTGDAKQAVELVEQLEPDVLVTDLEMPEVDGVELSKQILRLDPHPRVLMLTRHMRPGVLRRVLAVGVDGFLGKDAEPHEIAEAIRTVASGQRHVDSTIAVQALQDDCPLTSRELDVLRASRSGASVREIAVQLHLAQGTVSNYLSEAMAKLGSQNRHQAVKAAEDRGWL